jgi:hypothetical protein
MDKALLYKLKLLANIDMAGPVEVTPTVPGETIIDMPKIRARECFCPGLNNWDILKPIVYGGLVESITSLSIVSSAASTGVSARKFIFFYLSVIHLFSLSKAAPPWHLHLWIH